jgi:predicted Zn-ribbon and HTH transcriptional regulator
MRAPSESRWTGERASAAWLKPLYAQQQPTLAECREWEQHITDTTHMAPAFRPNEPADVEDEIAFCDGCGFQLSPAHVAAGKPCPNCGW